MQELFSAPSLISFFTLALLEIILGIDNVIFVSIIMGRMPSEQRKRARLLWMIFGIITRTLLLIALGWLLAQKGKSLFGFSLWGMDKAFDLASLVMIGGGLFLIVKTVNEIHHKLEGDEAQESGTKSKQSTFGKAILQIVLVDTVFSFDSVITASGIGHNLIVMILAVSLAMVIMFLFSGRIADFIHKHPTLTMLALSFLVMVGLVLVIDGWREASVHPPGWVHEEINLKNYVYFAMAFSFGVELLNMRLRRKTKPPVELREPRTEDIEVAEK
ncbi:MAG: TerC family protein [Bacteroidetes bacterium]|nr:TerC family protein [Bacteroidota bacterium]MBS1630651.1 TerC family protein [Bacteroidota bacterium]